MIPFRSLPSGSPRRVMGGVVVLMLAGLAAPVGAAGQTMSDPLVPRGRVRLDFAPSISFWDTRYGIGADGKDVEEALGMDLTDERGVGLFPGITTLEETLRSLSGDAGFEGRVGSTVGRLNKEVTRLDFGLRLGVFDWLTVGASVPYVRGRSTLDFAFRADSTANLGLNPASSGGQGVSDLLSALGEAAVAAESRAASLCAAASSEECSDATALAQRATGFWEGLFGAYFATPFFPLAGAPVAARLEETYAVLNAGLAAAGIPAVGLPLAFASTALDDAGFRALSTSSGVGMTPLTSYPGIWQMGDVEVNATVRLLDGEVRDSVAVSPRFAWALYGGFVVRLPTGILDDPNVLLDFAAGDGQQDLEGRVDAGLRVGSRLDFRGSFRHGTQAAVDILRRVAPHEALLPPASSLQAVRWTPGSYTHVELSPRIHLGEALALAGDYRRLHKGADAYELLGGETAGAPAADVTLLVRETEMTVEEVAVGLRYSS
ncbi:MAG: hypothetical protein JXR77_14025, partial [Lentisphaeria bacterium]|nr:hypothetical protein [Lentisphaeria bacterium]